jgi:protein-tyrosine-phosphatase
MEARKTTPASVLFVCTLNAVRSPMAAALLRAQKGQKIYVESAGVEAGALDPLAIEVMAEIGISMAAHHPRCFEELQDGSFDLVVALSPEAEAHARDLGRRSATQIEHWATVDPTGAEGTPEQRRAAYRAVRDTLRRQIAKRFG